MGGGAGRGSRRDGAAGATTGGAGVRSTLTRGARIAVSALLVLTTLAASTALLTRDPGDAAGLALTALVGAASCGVLAWAARSSG